MPAEHTTNISNTGETQNRTKSERKRLEALSLFLLTWIYGMSYKCAVNSQPPKPNITAEDKTAKSPEPNLTPTDASLI